MAVYTEVSDEELEAFVAGYGIGQVVSSRISARTVRAVSTE